MKKFKKVLIFSFAVLGLGLGLAACGKGKDSTSPKETGGSTTPTTSVDSTTPTTSVEKKVDGSFTLNTTTKVYDEKVVSFTKGTDYTLPDDYTGTETIKFYLDAEKQNEATEVKNAGTYYVVATLPATDKYNAYTSDPIEFVIEKAEFPKTGEQVIRKKSYDYNGKEQPMGPREMISNEGKYTYCWEENGEFTSAHPRKKDVGVYTAYYKFTPNDTNYKVVTGTVELTITKAPNSWVTKPSIENWTYGETEKKPVAEPKFGSVTYVYEKKLSTGDWIPLLPTKGGAGEYRVNVQVAGTENYEALTASVEFQVLKATNEWTTEPSIENWTYGETAKNPVAEPKFGEVNFTYKRLKPGKVPQWISIEFIDIVNVGTYQMEAQVKGTSDYSGLTNSPIEFEIMPKNLTGITIETTYDGTNTRSGLVLGSEHGIIGSDEVIAEIDGDIENLEFNVGEFDICGWEQQQNVAPVYLSGAGASNYNFYSGTLSVVKATNSWVTQPSITGWTYGDTPKVTKPTAKFGDVVCIYKKSATAQIGNSTLPKDAGTYYLQATVVGTDNYTSLSFDPIKFTIQKKTVTVNATKVYDGNDTINVATKDINGAVLADGISLKITMNSKNVDAIIATKTQNGDWKNYTLGTVKATITKRKLNQFNIIGQPGPLTIGTGNYGTGGKYFYNYGELSTGDTNGLISGDKVNVKVWFANENDMDDDQTKTQIVSSNTALVKGKAYIEISGGADMNNYQVDTSNLGTYIHDAPAP